MDQQSKIIIITSNEDLIRQLSSTTTNQTVVVEFDDEEQLVNLANSVSNKMEQDHSMDLALLAELSELNSKGDQMYAHILKSSEKNRSKAAKISKKEKGLICTICGDRAIGFNYNAISCASCKAFFLRHAHRHPETLKCLTNEGRCSVLHQVRRKCQRCRLNRCLAMGMRKDFVLTEEEKQRRRKQLEENRNISQDSSSATSTDTNSLTPTNTMPNSVLSFSNANDEIDHLLMDMDINDGDTLTSNVIDPDSTTKTMSFEDTIIIQNIRLSFSSIFPIDNLSSCCVDNYDHAAALVAWSEASSRTALNIIHFFRQIDEFENLHIDDRIILIKHNLLPVFPIIKCFNNQALNGACSDEVNEVYHNQRRFFMLRDDSTGIRETLMGVFASIIEITKQDPIVFSLLSSILLFSQGMSSFNSSDPQLKDWSAVNRAQNYYITLLCKYWHSKMDEVHIPKYLTQLLSLIFRIQSVTKIVRDFFRVLVITSNTVDKIAPLMHSVLHVS